MASENSLTENWVSPTTLPASIDAFLRLHDDRVQTFKSFDRALEQHKKNNVPSIYASAVSTCTAEFRVVGLKMKLIAETNSVQTGDSFGGSSDGVARLLFGRIQALEKRHLELEVHRHRLELARSKEQHRLAVVEAMSETDLHGSRSGSHGPCGAQHMELFGSDDAFPQATLLRVSEELSGVLREISVVVGDINGMISELKLVRTQFLQDE